MRDEVHPCPHRARRRLGRLFATHGLPRASAERYIKQYEAIFNPQKNRLSESIAEPTEDDVRRLVRSLLPRLRRVLTTTRSISLFVDGVVQQLQSSVGDLSGGTSGSGEVEMGDHSGSGTTERAPVA
jgi:hypothetical protein